MRQLPIALVFVSLASVACSDLSDEKVKAPDREPPDRALSATAAGGVRARAYFDSIVLVALDSASRLVARGDTVAARRVLGSADSRASSDPVIVVQLGAAQERVGDVGAAARTYRHYLSLAPSGPEADRARTRLAALVGGTGPYTTQLATGETVDTATRELSDPAIASTNAPASTPSATATGRPTRVAATNAADRAASRRSTARRTPPRSAPRTTVATATPAPRAEAETPRYDVPRVDTAVTTDDAFPSAATRTSAGTLAEMTPAPDSGTAPRKVHFSRWSRMQYWFVTKIAGLGGAGGVIVGAIVGNVPGAIAVGLAGGAASGLAKVHQDKVDSARMLRGEGPLATRRITRDSAAGEVDLLLPLMDTTTTAARRP